jgi:hypothetical protein
MAQFQTAAIAAALISASALAQPVDAKLSRVVIAVHDLKAAQRMYAGLGFAIIPGARHPTGTQNSLVAFGEELELSSLELITPYDVTLPEGRRYAESLEQGEGAIAAALEIGSAGQSARSLTAAGLKIKDPKREPQGWTLAFVDEAASRPLFLIQYDGEFFRSHPASTPHPNSASFISALLIAVNDAEKAAAGYANIGKLSPTEIELPEFGAVAKEIVLARGSIFLLRANDPSGPTARRLKEQGEGILGVRLDATDLDETRRVIRRKNLSKDDRFVF